MTDNSSCRIDFIFLACGSRLRKGLDGEFSQAVQWILHLESEEACQEKIYESVTLLYLLSLLVEGPVSAEDPVHPYLLRYAHVECINYI